MVSSYELGTTIRFTLNVYVGETLTDPDNQAVSFKVYAGTTQETTGTATRSSTGVYFCRFTSLATDPLGDYSVEWTGKYNTKDWVSRYVFRVIKTGFP